MGAMRTREEFRESLGLSMGLHPNHDWIGKLADIYEEERAKAEAEIAEAYDRITELALEVRELRVKAVGGQTALEWKLDAENAQNDLTAAKATIAELREELRDLLDHVAAVALDQTYGPFSGGDPNEFAPDPECSTEEERALHASDCARWNAGQRDGLTETRCEFAPEPGVIVRTPSGYGFGTTTRINEEVDEIRERIGMILARTEPQS